MSAREITDELTRQVVPPVSLAESALHAPFASFGGVEAYPTRIAAGEAGHDEIARWITEPTKPRTF